MGESINYVGLAGLIVFYLLIFFAGLFSQAILNRIRGKKEPKDEKLTTTDDMMLAGRDINYAIGIFTMTATWVGGGYINGAAEATIGSGVLWCQAPFCYAISLISGGIFFAKKMRKMEYVTMLDPLQEKYGKYLGALFYIPAFSGEILWSASILAALGTSLQVICKIGEKESIIASAGIAMSYTLFGGLYSVAFTDVFQLICIFVGLILAIPFMASNEHVASPLQSKITNWGMTGDNKSVLGEIKKEDAGIWIDHAIMMMCGGIPWQAYFQRVLSSRSPKVAQTLSIFAGFGCFCAAIPAVVIGVITLNTDWVATERGEALTPDEYKLAVPLTLEYLCPPAISFIGLGAVSAAVMSSTDSSILGVSSMFTRNVFVRIFMPKASDRIQLWALRATVLVNTAIAMAIAIAVKSVYGLYLICSDFVFVLLFPHLILVVHFPKLVNRYGMVVGFTIALLIRVLSGEYYLKYNAIIKFPLYEEPGSDEYGVQHFPFRTFCMLLHLTIALFVSYLTKLLYRKGHLFDFLCEYSPKPKKGTELRVVENALANDKLKNDELIDNAKV